MSNLFNWFQIGDPYLGITAIIAINLIISLFYHAFKLKWPDLYFSVNNMAAFFVTVSFKRYLAFRFVPVFLFSTIILGILMKNQSINVSISLGILSLFFHSVFTNGRAIYDLLTNSKRIKVYFNFGYQIVIHFLTFVSLIILGVASGLAAKSAFVVTITPSIQGIADNIWSALLTVLIIEYLRTIYTEKSIDVDQVFENSLNKIDPKILKYIDKVSLELNANPVLVKAICLVENIQRPKWIRNVENIKALLHLTGTYGIMQVRASKHVSDTESVKIAVEEYFSNSNGVKDSNSLSGLIKKYNPSKSYEDLILRAMYYIDPNSADYPG